MRSRAMVVRDSAIISGDWCLVFVRDWVAITSALNTVTTRPHFCNRAKTELGSETLQLDVLGRMMDWENRVHVGYANQGV